MADDVFADFSVADFQATNFKTLLPALFFFTDTENRSDQIQEQNEINGFLIIGCI